MFSLLTLSREQNEVTMYPSSREQENQLAIVNPISLSEIHLNPESIKDKDHPRTCAFIFMKATVK